MKEIKIDITKLSSEELKVLREITYRYNLMEETKAINYRIIEIEN